jgi:hypothetical protein
LAAPRPPVSGPLAAQAAAEPSPVLNLCFVSKNCKYLDFATWPCAELVVQCHNLKNETDLGHFVNDDFQVPTMLSNMMCILNTCKFEYVQIDEYATSSEISNSMCVTQLRSMPATSFLAKLLSVTSCETQKSPHIRFDADQTNYLREQKQ